MLTITPNSDATILNISHPNLVATAKFLTLKMSADCNSSLLTFDVSAKTASITNNSFNIVPADIYPTNTPSRFPDGVYYWELLFKYPVGANDHQYNSNVCMFIDYTLKCTIDLRDLVTLKKYRALQYSTSCDTCTCATLCNLFNSLTNITKDNGSPCSGCN